MASSKRKLAIQIPKYKQNTEQNIATIAQDGFTAKACTQNTKSLVSKIKENIIFKGSDIAQIEKCEEHLDYVCRVLLANDVS